jgi:hypothetical protein
VDVVDELGPRVRARQDHLESEHAQRVHDARGELEALGLGDELLERIVDSEGGDEVVAVHDAVDHAVDQAPKGLQKYVVSQIWRNRYIGNLLHQPLCRCHDQCTAALPAASCAGRARQAPVTDSQIAGSEATAPRMAFPRSSVPAFSTTRVACLSHSIEWSRKLPFDCAVTAVMDVTGTRPGSTNPCARILLVMSLR